MSINGGVYTAHERGVRIGCTTIQLFTKNNTRWRSKPLSEGDIDRYKHVARKSAIRPVVAHSSYLINLCAKSRLILKKSREAFRDELWRCEKLGIPYLVFHPGAHVGRGE
jgi:deoxyribonuclease-4